MTDILYFIAGTEPTTSEQADIDEITATLEVGVRSAAGMDTYGAKLEPTDYVAGTVPADYSAIPVYADQADGKVLYFIEGVEPTPSEQLAIDALNAVARRVKVRTALVSSLFGNSVEPSDFVAGTVPASYSAVPVYSLGGPLVTTPPALDGLVARSGVTLTRTAGVYAPQGGGTVTVTEEYQVNGVQVSTGATYTPGDADHGLQLSYVEVATEVGGTDDGEITRRVALGAVLYALPVAGTIADVNAVLDDGDVIVNLSAGFTGTQLTYTATRGVVAGSTLTLSTSALFSGNVTITATDPDDQTAQVTFALSITEAPAVSVLPYAPTLRFHPEASTVTLGGDNRVTAATDLAGTQNANLPVGEEGPEEITDLAGNKFWRFNDGQMLNVGSGFTAGTRDCTVIMVLRENGGNITNHMFGLGSRELATQVNSLNTLLYGRTNNGSGRAFACSNRLGYQSLTTPEMFRPGSQKQVIGVTSQTSGVTFQLNTTQSSELGAAFNVSDVVGAELGRYPWQAGSYGVFDMYEAVVFSPALTAPQMSEVIDQLLIDHDVTPFTNQFLIEGDSISAGTTVTLGPNSPAAILSEPGRGLIPADWRVVSQASSGDTIADITGDRDDGNDSVLNQMLPGRNVVAFEIGRNDWSSNTGAQVYAAVVDYLNTPVMGVLQKGWEVRAMLNIASGPALDQQRLDQIALMEAPAFLTDCLAGTGQLYDGMLRRVPSYLIQHDGGGFPFRDTPPDPAYIAGDATHPNLLGATVRITGGETPENGIAYQLV